MFHLFQRIKDKIVSFVEDKKSEMDRKKFLERLLCQQKGIPSSVPSVSVERLSGEKLTRAFNIVSAAEQGTQFVTKGSLMSMGCVELPEGFHLTANKNAYVAEFGMRAVFVQLHSYPQIALKYKLYKKGQEDKIFSAIYHNQVQQTGKPLYVLEHALIFKITPDMSLEQIDALRKKTYQKKVDFDVQKRKDEKRVQDEFDQSYHVITLKNMALWEKYLKENELAPQTDFVPMEFSKDSSIRLKSLKKFAAFLEKSRCVTGKITAEDILKADNIAGLSFDMQKVTDNDPTMPSVRFEGSRFWADVILGRTWLYGKELLEAEGFTPEEVKKIQEEPKIPTNYTFYENLSHPFMTDVRVKEFLKIVESMEVKKVVSHETGRVIKLGENING